MLEHCDQCSSPLPGVASCRACTLKNPVPRVPRPISSSLASRYEIQAVAFDPFQATQLSTRMLSEGLPMIEVRPTVLNFSEPMKTLEALVLQKKLVHDGGPVLGWMASNVVAHLDVKDNIYPRKERAENKIDGIVALIMALSRAIKPGESVVLGSDYELMVL